MSQEHDERQCPDAGVSSFCEVSSGPVANSNNDASSGAILEANSRQAKPASPAFLKTLGVPQVP